MIDKILYKISVPGNPRFTKLEKQYILNKTKNLYTDSDSVGERLYYMINGYTDTQKCKCCNDKPRLWKPILKYLLYFCKDCMTDYDKILKSDIRTEKYSDELVELVKGQLVKKTAANVGKGGNYFGLLLKFETNFLPPDSSVSSRMYYVSNNIYEPVKCKLCDNMATWTNGEGYKDVCGKCVKSYHKTIQKTKATWLKNHGVDHPFKRQDVVDKRNNTFKIDKDNITKKRQETNIKKYNDFRLSTLTFEKWADKITNDNNYSDDQLKLLFNNCINNKSWLEDQTNKKRTIFYISQVLGLNYRLLYRSFEYYKIIPYHSPVSYPEFQLTKFINTLGFGVINNTRQIIPPLELDVYVPDRKFAIEYDGLYWHKDTGNNKDYHLNKTKICDDKDIHLFHIFEHEWIDHGKQEIWKSIIRNKLGKSERIYARKTEVRLVTSKDKSRFLIGNHLQGDCVSRVNLGLYIDDNLVSLMTFGKSRYDKKMEWELLRFCNRLNTSVVGGASKLLKYFRCGNDGSIISYADKRRSNGNLYRQLGFEYSHDSRPGYWYFNIGNPVDVYHRSVFMKHKLKNKLKIFDSELSEYDNMVVNGWERIFDCGNQVWKMK